MSSRRAGKQKPAHWYQYNASRDGTSRRSAKGNQEDEPKSVRLDRVCGMDEARRPLSAQDVRKRKERLRSAGHDLINE